MASTPVKGFRDLRVWQSGMDLVENVYGLTNRFPNEERFGLVSQMQRAAVSVPSNIAEGHAKTYIKEYLRHLSSALGSLAELQTQAEIALRLGYVPAAKVDPMVGAATVLTKQLYSLRNALERATERAQSLPKTQHPKPNTHSEGV